MHTLYADQGGARRRYPDGPLLPAYVYPAARRPPLRLDRGHHAQCQDGQHMLLHLEELRREARRGRWPSRAAPDRGNTAGGFHIGEGALGLPPACLLYTSEAADD